MENRTNKVNKSPKNLVGTRSPWGKIDQAQVIDEGIVKVGTPGHGGLKVSAERNQKIPESVRTPGGWYEEDCEFSIVVCVFPESFPEKTYEQAIKTCKDYFPEAFFEITGQIVHASESLVLRRALFKIEHANDYVVVSAVGSWDDRCPKHMVLCTASLGGRHNDGSVGETEDFLVPEDEYQGRSGEFVIDIERHKKYVRQ